MFFRTVNIETAKQILDWADANNCPCQINNTTTLDNGLVSVGLLAQHWEVVLL